MMKAAGLFVLLAMLARPAMAQDTQAPTPPEEQAPTAPTAPTEPTEPARVKHIYPVSKHEISGGFVYRSYYGPSATTIGMIGGYGGYQYNYYRWLSLEADALFVSGTLKVTRLPPEDLHVITALAGPKIYPIGRHRIDPFGHFNYGVGILTSAVPPFSGYGGNSSATFVKAWQAGGGVDLNLRSHWAVRVVQFDYVNAKFLGNGIPNQGGKRVSFGIVYRFGEK